MMNASSSSSLSSSFGVVRRVTVCICFKVVGRLVAYREKKKKNKKKRENKAGRREEEGGIER